MALLNGVLSLHPFLQLQLCFFLFTSFVGLKRCINKERKGRRKEAVLLRPPQTLSWLGNGLIRFVLSKRIAPMRCRNFFSAAIRQGSEAWPSFSDNNFWICLLFFFFFSTPVALSHHRLVFPFHPILPKRRPPPPFFLSVCLPPHSFFFFLFLSLCSCLPQRFVQRTVVATAFAFQAPVAVTTAGRAPGVTRGRVTRAATSMALARTADVNAARAGTENTARLVGREEASVWVGDRLELYVCVWFGVEVGGADKGPCAATLPVCV